MSNVNEQRQWIEGMKDHSSSWGFYVKATRTEGGVNYEEQCSPVFATQQEALNVLSELEHLFDDATITAFCVLKQPSEQIAI